MKRIPILLLVLALAALPVVVAAEEEAAKTTVKGEVLDLACYAGSGARGADHAGCARSCVKNGQPMGLLAEDGTVYVLSANHKAGDAFEAAKEHAGAMVELTGTPHEAGGVKVLEVLAVKAL